MDQNVLSSYQIQQLIRSCSKFLNESDKYRLQEALKKAEEKEVMAKVAPEAKYNKESMMDFARHVRSRVFVTAQQRQSVLLRLDNVKNSLYRIKKHPIYGALRAQVAQLHHEVGQKDKKGGLTVQDVQRLHRKSAQIQCKINCAALGRSRKSKV